MKNFNIHIGIAKEAASDSKDDDKKKDVRIVVELKSWQSKTGRCRGSQNDVENKMGRENETRKDNVFSRMDKIRNDDVCYSLHISTTVRMCALCPIKPDYYIFPL